MENPEIGNESDWFRMPSGLFMQTVILHNGKYWTYILLALILIGLILGIVVDYRYAIMSLMILFVLLPLELLFIYLYFGLYETFYFNTILHKIIIDSSEINVLMKWSKVADGNDTTTEEDLIKSISFKRGLFGNYVVLKDSVIVFTRSNKGFLWLPVSAFEDEKSFTSFFNKLIE